MTEVEEWRAIGDWPGYEVSSLGRVRSVTRVVVRSDGRRLTFQGRILKPGMQRSGHLHVVLSDMGNKRQKVARIHHEVCLAFHGPAPSSKHEAAHWDGVHKNNNADNIRWATHRENAIDAVVHGKRVTATTGVEKAKQIRNSVNEAITMIAEGYGVSRQVVRDIYTKRTYDWL